MSKKAVVVCCFFCLCLGAFLGSYLTGKEAQAGSSYVSSKYIMAKLLNDRKVGVYAVAPDKYKTQIRCTARSSSDIHVEVVPR
jgi:hypothetical protein